MVAGAARGLGFYMGHALENNNEDLEFSYKSLEQMKNTIRARNVTVSKMGLEVSGRSELSRRTAGACEKPAFDCRVPDLAATSAGHVRGTSGRRASPSPTYCSRRRRTFCSLFGGACRRCWSVMKKHAATGQVHRRAIAIPGRTGGSRPGKLIAYLAPGKYKKFEDSVTADLPTDQQEQVQAAGLRRPPRPSTCFRNVSNS